MGAIQSAVNSMIGSASHAVMAVKGYQELKAKKEAQAAKAKGSPQAQAAEKAKSTVSNEVEAKKTQRRNFSEYLKKQQTSFGGTVGELSPEMQKQIAKQYTPAQRKALMDRMDKEAKSGSNKPSKR